MRKIIVTLAVLLLLLGPALVSASEPAESGTFGGFAVQLDVNANVHEFTDVGGNDATASIRYTRDGSDNPVLNIAFTTSDTTALRASASGLDFGTNSVLFGSAIGTNDVTLSRGAANRLDLATGDSFNIVSGSLQIGGTEVIDSSGDVQADGRVVVNCTALAVADQVDQSCFIADRAYTVTRIDLVYTTAESAGTLNILPTKQEGTEAPASGQALLSADFDGTATAETVQNGTLTGTGADLVLAAGDRLGLDYQDDTAGELAGVVVTFVLDPS